MTRPVHPDRAPRATLWALRAGLSAHAASAVAQPLLIGAYLDGNFDLLASHRANGQVVLPVTLLLAGAAALAYAVAGRGAWHPVAALATLFLLEGVQIGMGYARVLTLHLPLGILIVVGSAALAWWSWTGRARRSRPPRAARPVTGAPFDPDPPPTPSGPDAPATAGPDAPATSRQVGP